MSHMGRAPKTSATLEELRARIERGRYEVKPDRVAEAMLRRGITFGRPRPAKRRD
jgi:anti-sigma28 factor (negative regulator of flagellin synthesis)